MKKYTIGFLVLTAGIFIGFRIQSMMSGDNVFEQMKKFDFIFNTAYRNYVDEVDTGKLMEGAIEGMLGTLDPHSTYMSADEMKSVREDFQGSFDGIGVEFDMINDTITIISPIQDGPSEKLGIQAGDKIVKIDGENATGLSRDQVPKKLRGVKGTKVTVDIKRAGTKDLLHYEIIRDKIPLNTVNASYMIDKTNIGFIQVDRFAATTHSEMMDAVRNLKKQGMKQLILDLRGNPGGYLNQAFEMADEFLPAGDTIVFTKARKTENDELYMSSRAGELEDIPVIVMVNAGSASASEIVSGAIQDLDRGLVVGTTSYGKGLVQRQFETGDGSAFRVTIARYYTPSGRCIQRPYKDKDDYRKLVGRLELEEGDNMTHSLDKIKKEEAKKAGKEKINMDSIPIYYTKSGRPLLGGGGITPDYVVKADTSRLTALVSQFFGKSLYNDFVSSYMVSPNGQALKAKYQANFTDYLRNFKVTKEMSDEFVKLGKTKITDWKDSEFDTDKEYVNLIIKANIARIIWNRSSFLQVTSSIDRQLNKAVNLFDEAEKIHARRKH
jgi:carboxyl-terminal processing protease